MDIKPKIKAIFCDCIKECLSKNTELTGADISFYVFGKGKDGSYLQFIQSVKANGKEISNSTSLPNPKTISDNCDIDGILNKNLNAFERNAMKLAGYDKEKIQKLFNEKLAGFSAQFAKEQNVKEEFICFCFRQEKEDVVIYPFLSNENRYCDKMSIDTIIKSIEL